LLVLSKYKAPDTRALPSLSTVGALDLDPKYRSSKLSSAASAESLAASAAVWADAADEAELLAAVADVALLPACVVLVFA
jgi:hypothetical protein